MKIGININARKTKIMKINILREMGIYVNEEVVNLEIGNWWVNILDFKGIVDENIADMNNKTQLAKKFN